MTLRNDILGLLQRGDATVVEIATALVKKKSRIDEETQIRGDILKTLLALKHEHRAWTTDHNKWTITSKGRKTHG